MKKSFVKIIGVEAEFLEKEDFTEQEKEIAATSGTSPYDEFSRGEDGNLLLWVCRDWPNREYYPPKKVG